MVDQGAESRVRFAAPSQVEWELRHLLCILDDHKPQRILEIGIYDGGTLWDWIELGDHVVAVDEQMRDAPTWLDHARSTDTQLHLIHGDSHDAQVIARVNDFGPFDFVFIDADHSYAGVSADWDAYRPMLATGGIVALHDIVERPSYGVSRLWAEIKQSAPTIEIIDGSRANYCGIGVIWP